MRVLSRPQGFAVLYDRRTIVLLGIPRVIQAACVPVREGGGLTGPLYTYAPIGTTHTLMMWSSSP